MEYVLVPRSVIGGVRPIRDVRWVTMGQHASCPKCRFSFYGGHSHHSGTSDCLCLGCKTRYICPTRSPWGPEIGEEIEVCRASNTTRKRKKGKTGNIPKKTYVPTGVVFKAERGEPFQHGDTVSYFVHYPVDAIPCPNCGERQLTFGFEPGAKCPMCQDGTLVLEAIEY